MEALMSEEDEDEDDVTNVTLCHPLSRALSI